MSHQKELLVTSDEKREQDRASKAFRKMEKLGFDAETVRPVLLRLLEVYNGNWALIKEGGYHNLIDAVLEVEEDKLKTENAPAAERKKIRTGFSEARGKKPYGYLGEEGQTSNIGRGKKPYGYLGEEGQTSNIGRGKKPYGYLGEEGQTPNSGRGKKPYGYLGEEGQTSNIGRGKKHYEVVTAGEEGQRSKSGRVDPTNITNQPARLATGDKYGKSQACYQSRDKMRAGFSEGHGRKHCVINLEEGQSSKYDPTNRFNQSARLTIGNKDSSIRNILVRDITKGKEKVPITLLKASAEDANPDFNYIRDSIVYQSASIQSSLARVADDECCAGCKGNCLSSFLPCACARDTGGEFAYTREGLLTEKFLRDCISSKEDEDNRKHFVYCQVSCPLERIKNKDKPEKCKGHLIRKFIKECWEKCGCSMRCGNRVVQRGITRKIQVFQTEDKGWGIRTLEKLPAGAFVYEFSGEIMTNSELYERNNNRSNRERHVYPVLLDADWGSEEFLDEDALCLDATYYGNVARFMNHQCFDGNMIEIPVQVETPDRHYYHLAFFTTREVDAFEELTWDYGLDFDDDNHPVKAFRCRCESANCRDRNRNRNRKRMR